MLELIIILLVICVLFTLGLTTLITIGNRNWKKFFYNLKMTSLIIGIAFGIIVIGFISASFIIF